MADFALVATACETKFWPAGTFRTAHDLNRAEVVEALIEADPVASAARSLMVRHQFWKGQARDLDNLSASYHRKSCGRQELAGAICGSW